MTRLVDQTRARARIASRLTVVTGTLAIVTLTGALSCAAGSSGTVDFVTANVCTSNTPSGLRTGSASGIRLWMIPPRLSDPCIAASVDSHVVFRAESMVGPPRLFVFLPGTGGAPRHYRRILLTAAQAGYHAVGLVYPNDVSVSVRCASAPQRCYEDTRREVLLGDDRSDVIAVNRANSIEHRLRSALRLMAERDPAGQWRRFLTPDSAVDWSEIAIAGHSQGGGFALFIAQQFLVRRASTYASYGDYLPGTGRAASWVTRPYATPASRLFGLISAKDEAISYKNAVDTWLAIGMGGALVDADDVITTGSLSASQRVVTTHLPAHPQRTATPFHDLVVLDVQTPLATESNTPVFSVIWRLLSFP